jgi:hypothetical protein
VGHQYGAGVPRGEEIILRKILVVGALLLAVLLVVFRQRVYVRDPLAEVERNGVAQDGARVFFNYSNDVLMEEQVSGARVEWVAWGSKASVLFDGAGVLDGGGPGGGVSSGWSRWKDSSGDEREGSFIRG